MSRVKDFLNDFSREEVLAAFVGNCLDPEGEEKIARGYYADVLHGFHDFLEEELAAEDAERREDEFAAFREELKRLFRAFLEAQSRCMAYTVTPGMKEEVERKLRRLSDERLAERLACMVGMEVLVKDAKDDLWRVCSGSADMSNLPSGNDTPEERKACLSYLRRVYSHMAEVNEILHEAGADRNRKAKGLRGLGMDDGKIEQMMTPNILGTTGFSAYCLSRSLGRIKAAERFPETGTASEGTHE